MVDITILPNDAFYPFVLSKLRAAQRCVYISFYCFKVLSRRNDQRLKDVLDLLFLLHKKNVDVRCVFNYGADANLVLRSNKSVFEYMRNNGMQVVNIDKRKTNHSKIILIDDYISIVGSHNFSTKSLFKNNEVSICLYDRQVYEELKKYFLEVYRSGYLQWQR